jgi:hypothetical protein
MIKIRIFFMQLFCEHWWKAMTATRSAYFVDNQGEDILWEVSECKQCGKTKVYLINQ